MNSGKKSSNNERTIVSRWKTIVLGSKVNNALEAIRGLLSHTMNNPSTITGENTAKNSINSKETELSELIGSMLAKVNQLDNSESMLSLLSVTASVLGKSMTWPDQEKLKYINHVLLPFLGKKGPLKKVLEGDIDIILQLFQNILKNKCLSIVRGDLK